MKLEISGALTSGYYKAMEAVCPIFIDGEPIDGIIKDWLKENDLDEDFSSKSNELVGRRIRFTFEIEELPG